MASSHQVRTRLLILSDTHGHALLDPARDGAEALRYGFRRPLPPADVALHCGDLTLRSTPAELETTLDLMREVDAPLKLVIPGNHDSSLDLDFWEQKCLQRERHKSPSQAASLRRIPQECAALIQKARQQDDRIHVLTREGTYHFVLPPHGARFTIFTSPWTPAYGRWGFQYEEEEATRHFTIGSMTDEEKRKKQQQQQQQQQPPPVDVVMTHGPPFGVLDDTRIGSRAGCAYLLEAVARARPQVHCFGHIHESAGAALVRWRHHPEDEDEDEEGGGSVAARAEVVTTTASGSQLDEQNGGIRPLNLCASGSGSIGFEPGKQTLFVNAAVMTVNYQPLQSPWLVDLELPLADEAHRAKAEETRALLAS